MAAMILEDFSGPWDTSWGRTLLVEVGAEVVAMIVALKAFLVAASPV